MLLPTIAPKGKPYHHVIVDVARPPTGQLNLFNLYVALSRSSGRDSIRLLQDFDDNTFLKLHEMELMAEDDRLEELNENTKTWWGEIDISLPESLREK